MKVEAERRVSDGEGGGGPTQQIVIVQVILPWFVTAALSVNLKDLTPRFLYFEQFRLHYTCAALR